MKKCGGIPISGQELKPIAAELPAMDVRMDISISPPYPVLTECGLQKRCGSILLPYLVAVKKAFACDDNTGIHRERFAFSREMAGIEGCPCVVPGYEYAKNRQHMGTNLTVVDFMGIKQV